MDAAGCGLRSGLSEPGRQGAPCAILPGLDCDASSSLHELQGSARRGNAASAAWGSVAWVVGFVALVD